MENIALAFRVNANCVFTDGFSHIRYHRQVFVVNLDSFQPLDSRLLGFSDDQSYLISFKSNMIGKSFGGIWAAENRLIHHAQTIFVFWNVPRS